MCLHWSVDWWLVLTMTGENNHLFRPSLLPRVESTLVSNVHVLNEIEKCRLKIATSKMLGISLNCNALTTKHTQYPPPPPHELTSGCSPYSHGNASSSCPAHSRTTWSASTLDTSSPILHVNNVIECILSTSLIIMCND